MILFKKLFRPFKKQKSLIGNTGIALSNFKPRGEVHINNEKWQAFAYKNQHINKGNKIIVVNIKNLLLEVKKL